MRKEGAGTDHVFLRVGVVLLLLKSVKGANLFPESGGQKINLSGYRVPSGNEFGANDF